MAKEFNIIVAGCGGMSHAWGDYAVREKAGSAKIVALVDISRPNAERFRQKYGLDCGIFASVAEALAARPDANLLLDVTIPSAHREVVTTALRGGCDVLGEKPMAESLEDALAMVACAKETGRTYALMQNYRYNAGIHALCELVRGGGIGAPGFLCADFFLGPRFGGFRDIMDSPLLKDMSIHTFDAARFILGADPVSVYCHEFNPPGSWYKGNASAVAIFEMSNGAVFCYRGSWCADGMGTGWNAHWRAQGSLGTATWMGGGDEMPEYEVRDEAGRTVRLRAQNAYTGRDGHAGCFDELYAALESGARAQTDCTDNIKSIAMVLKAVESAREGRKVLF